jgi:hypothetical protein
MRACGSSSPGSWPIIRTRGEIKRVFADGNYVILHSRWHGLSDNPRGEAVVDIFRLENGKMVEHWEVIQPIPEMAANNNTMFCLATRSSWPLRENQKAAVVALAVAKVNGAALAGLRVRLQRRHPADGLHFVRSDLQSEQIAIEAQRVLHVANADSNV